MAHSQLQNGYPFTGLKSINGSGAGLQLPADGYIRTGPVVAPAAAYQMNGGSANPQMAADLNLHGPGFYTNAGSYTPQMLQDRFLMSANANAAAKAALARHQNGMAGSGPTSPRVHMIPTLSPVLSTLPNPPPPPPPPPPRPAAVTSSASHGLPSTKPINGILKSHLVTSHSRPSNGLLNGSASAAATAAHLIPGYQSIKLAAREQEIDHLTSMLASKLGPNARLLSGTDSVVSSSSSSGSSGRSAASGSGSSQGPAHHTYSTLDHYGNYNASTYSDLGSAIYEVPRDSLSLLMMNGGTRPTSQLSNRSGLSSHSGSGLGNFVPNVYQGILHASSAKPVQSHSSNNQFANSQKQNYRLMSSASASAVAPQSHMIPVATAAAAAGYPTQRSVSGPSLPTYGGSVPPSSSNHVTSSSSLPTVKRTPIRQSEVDKLTSLLVANLENSTDPDYFGMCYKCGKKVSGEGSGCTAMERVYHIACFTCVVCEKELRGQPFYAMDGKPYCEADYLNTLEKCSVCARPILDRILRATGKPYHPACFTCTVCGVCLDGIPFTVDATNRIYCIDDFHRKFAPRCCVCSKPIVPETGQSETVRIVALDRSFHVQCYKCEDCGLLLSNEADGRGGGCFPLDNRIFCRNCNALRVQALTAHG